MRIIICGYGLIGKFLINYFSSLNLNITLIEKDKEKIQEVKAKHDILVVEGEILNHEILQFTNVGSSDLFIACSDSDSVNIISCQLAKKMGCHRVVARIYNTGLFSVDNKLENIIDLEIYFKVNRLLSPSGLAARYLANIISNEKGALFQSYFLNKLDVIKIPILADTSVIGKPIKKLHYLFKKNIKFLACYNQNNIIHSTQYILQDGDELLLCGRSGSIQRILHNFHSKKFKKNKKIYIIGNSREVVETIPILLDKKLHITLFDDNKQTCDYLQSKYDITTIYSNLAEYSNIKYHDLSQPRAIICGDENDSINLTYALNAELHDLKNIIPIVHDLEKIKLFDLFNFKHTISPSNIFIQEIIAYFNNNLIKQEFSFIKDPTTDEKKQSNKSIAIIKSIIKNSNWLGNSLNNFVKSNQNLKIICIYRNNNLYFAETEFNNIIKDDKILLASLNGSAQKEIRNILKIV